MLEVTDWVFCNKQATYPAWYRFLKTKEEIPEGMDVTFKDGYPIIAAIFYQDNEVFFCACNSNRGTVFGELDDMFVEDEDLEIVMLKIDIKLHSYGYRVVPGRKDVKNLSNLC